MLAYLSDEWIRALDQALSDDVAFHDATRDTTLVVQNVITGGPSGVSTYAVTLDRGANHIEPGTHARADVSFTCDHATAVAIASGAESAQGAFMAGRLRIGGDARKLMDNQAVLADLGDVFAAVRDETDFGSGSHA